MTIEEKIIEYYKDNSKKIECKKQLINLTFEAFESIKWMQVINVILSYESKSRGI
jgi:hypothetical protein